jgi:hypothetical protein
VYWLGTVKRFIEPSEQIPVLTHTPLPNTVLTTGPFTVAVTIESSRSILPGATKLCWRLNGGAADTLLMAAAPDENVFVAEIPGSTTGTIEYFIMTQDETGTISTLPRGAPEESFVFVVGESTTDHDVEIGEFSLDQNYPNPFNPTTTIRLRLPDESAVSLRIYDVTGKEIRDLANAVLPPGVHTFAWDATSDQGARVASGVYLYRIVAGSLRTGHSFVQQKKMILLR